MTPTDPASDELVAALKVHAADGFVIGSEHVAKLIARIEADAKIISAIKAVKGAEHA